MALGLAIAAGFMLLTNKPKWNDYLAFGVIVAGLAASWVILHPVQTPLMDDAKKVRAMIGAGTPSCLNFNPPTELPAPKLSLPLTGSNRN